MTEQALRMLLALGGLALVGMLLFGIVPIRSDVSVLMADGADSDLPFLARALNEGPANRIVLIGVEPAAGSGEPADPAGLSRTVKATLLETGLFETVSNGEVGLDARDLRPFFDNRYRLNPPLAPESFSVAGLETAFDRLLQRLAGLDAPLVKTIMAADPTLRTLDVARHWASSGGARLRTGVWTDAAGRRALLVGVTRAAGYDLGVQEKMVGAVVSAVRKAEARYGSQTLILSGPPVIAVESKRLAEGESRRLMILSSILVVGFLVLAFRRVSFLPAVLIPIGCGFLAGAAAVGALFGQIHVTTLGFGATLIGVAVDYPLHLMGHSAPERRPVETARMISAALALGVLTSAIGFMPLALSTFPGVAQLGVFTVAGLLAAAAITRWGLPQLLPPPVGERRPAARGLREAADAFGQRCRLPAIVLGLVAAGYLAWLGDGLWTSDLTALSPIPEKLRSNDRLLRGDLNAVNPRYLMVITGTDAEAVLEKSEAVAPVLENALTGGKLTGFDMAAGYLPSAKRQAALLAALPEEVELRDRVARAMAGRPFRPGTFEPFIRAVAKAKADGPLRPGSLNDDVLTARIGGLLTGKARDRTQGLVMLHGSDAAAAAQEALDAAELNGIQVFDLKQETQTLLEDYRDETVSWALVGAALAVVVLFVALRNMRAVAGVAAPVAIALAVTAALTAALSGGLSLFNILALMIVGGLGIDYAVFLRRGEMAAAGEAIIRTHALRTVFVCMVTSLIVFSVMATAAIPILAQIGLPVAIGSVFSFVLAVAFVDRQPGSAT
ncbi:MAG: MMPL family transporter [Alphaproteobacteria bacterium]|nr:MMPL family transporter [Alphaproteobacteria bacterium]